MGNYNYCCNRNFEPHEIETYRDEKTRKLKKINTSKIHKISNKTNKNKITITITIKLKIFPNIFYFIIS